MSVELIVTPHGRLAAEEGETDPPLPIAAGKRIFAAFGESTARGLMRLALEELPAAVPAAVAFARHIGRSYLTRLCHLPSADDAGVPVSVPVTAEDLAFLAMQAPPMKGAEYLSPELLGRWWQELDALIQEEIARAKVSAKEWLRTANPLWRMIGRVTFHLAENKRNPTHPFAFLATYAERLSEHGKVQHLPLSRALQAYAGPGNRQTLVTLLTPIQRATERSALAKELVDTGQVYQPLAWTPRQAHRFLLELPMIEESGIVVRVPDWWKPAAPPRAAASVRIGEARGSRLSMDALLDFKVSLSIDGEPLTDEERERILGADGGLVSIRGKWIEVDREKLAAALAHWEHVEQQNSEGIPFHEAMRMLSGAALPGDAASVIPEEMRQWTGVLPGKWLDDTLAELRHPAARADGIPGLNATLRPYQEVGTQWLIFMTRLGLGACLADDMGLGKTIQVLAMLLEQRARRGDRPAPPALLIVPASLVPNWKSEAEKFAPSLSLAVAHPSEWDSGEEEAWQSTAGPDLAGRDVVITTYSMLTRLAWLKERPWQMAILDEAQAIKNAGTRQAQAAKSLKASARIALTGTPVENRLSDLWSIFDFLNPSLLGSAKAFASLVKRLAANEQSGYRPLRTLVQPYILRRLKSDKTVISDLPDKAEMRLYATLSREQATMYEHAVKELATTLDSVDGIQRRGVVLAFLLRFKQICNHPSQWLGDGRFEPKASGKFARLAELCSTLAERQERALIFTQFREMTEPLAEFLRGIFGRPGLVLHGQTPVPARKKLVDDFQREDGPPFFVLSIKAGGTGLNLTAATHVIHFDRWWNPAVENQATDRAYRIGQKKSVLVHKFVCRGTVEEQIDQMIADKVGLSQEILEGSTERRITEMDNRELLRFVSLDIHRALEA